MSVPTNEKDLSGRPGHLNETQQAAFDEFKSKVDSTHDQATRRWYDDTTLLRFLRARSFSVPKALEQFNASSTWRTTTNVDSIYTTFPIDEFESSRAFYPRWTGKRDKLGRPIYVFRLASLASHSKDLTSTPEQRRYERIIALTELLCRFILPLCADLRTEDNSVDCVTTIIDLEGVSLSSLWSLKSHLQQSISLTSDNYPETINTICVVNAPSFFPTIWSWVKGMFDEGTRNKVHLFASEPGAELQEVIPVECLPKVYGGQLDWKYEDEPLLDEEIKAKIGQDSMRGPAVWEDGRMILVGEGRHEDKGKGGGEAPSAAGADAANGSSTPTPSHTPALATAPGPPAQA